MPKKIAAPSVDRAPNHASAVGELHRLGFSDYEARTYLSLLQVNPATAYEISKHTGLPRANTYSALGNLTRKRAVQPVSENPVRYAPVAPDVLLDRLATEVSDTCLRLKDSLKRMESAESSDVVWSIEGQEQIERKIEELIQGAKQHIWIKASTDVLQRHVRELKRAAARGVSLVFVVFGEDVDFLCFGRQSKVYLHEGNGLRMGGADNLFTIASDYRIALTASVAESLSGAYTTNPSVVRMAESLIRHDIYMAEMMSEFGREIEERFGVGLVKLRRQLFSPEQLALLETNLAKNSALAVSRAKLADAVAS